MKVNLKNILIAVVGVVVLVILIRFAWVLAGFLIKLVFTVLILALLIGLGYYFYTQLRRR
ncbi:MAG: hypothetical protein GXY32_06885 [Ruminococcaceae bacterium]|nr:hypothetical protein [Oscillospiraceae bacterium]